ncbi:hypothetical protein [Citrobacter sp. Cf224]|uniref:hypothetical protein n=1 Tax=Citrobacter sp. Cf224 TaxID=2985087 RepID=UPI002578B4C9|nr:hypothetical protein [Citrobacter sp. Cf224]MDM3069145.1 hypothetical protein [Citrobacter sp. Cf224]
MTTNHPAHGPVSLERLHQIREILSKAAAQSDGGNLGYAMADAVKVIDSAIALFSAEPVGITDRNEIECLKRGEMANVMPPDYRGVDKGDEVYIYTAPPVPELMKDHQIRELVNDLRDIAIEYHGTQQFRERIARTVRAAMLQAGNSPETPDGWVLVPKEMTPEMMRAVQIKSELGGYAASELSGAYDMFREFWGVAVTSAPLYTAPSELVTPDGSTCKYCGGTGYFRWQKSAETFPCPCVGCDLPSAGGK